MKNYTIAEQFAVIALNAQDSLHESVAKNVAVVGIAAAKTVQTLLYEDDNRDAAVFEQKLREQLDGIKKMKRKERNALEKEFTDILKAEGILKEIPNLLGCDMNYYTANVTMREYKSDSALYQSLIEKIRACALEQTELPEDIVILLWLFRESGCMHDIFSQEEQERGQIKLIQAAEEKSLYKAILEQEFHSAVWLLGLKFMNWKHKIFTNPYLEGVNLMFPFLDRRQAIFIDMVIMGTSVKDRRSAAIAFLEKNGHTCEEIKNGTETIVKVDNEYYRIFPSTRSFKIPIQGVELLPVYK